MKKGMFTCALLVLCTLHLHTQPGKVGIGTDLPKAALHIAGDLVAVDTIKWSGLPDAPVSGPGTRMLWYGDKAAFRAGHILSTQWDQPFVGYYSFAAGYNPVASGINSIALGEASATGYHAVSIGTLTHAFGDYSFAAGDGSTAAFTGVAIGYRAKAIGNYGISIGAFSEAIGSFSNAFGYDTRAVGETSFALGNETVADGDKSFSAGFRTRASGMQSSAWGRNTIANGFASTVVGIFNDSIMPPQTVFTGDTPLFIIGNGDAHALRNNALVVRKDGRVGIGTSSPACMLDVLHTIRACGAGWPASGEGLELAWNPATNVGYIQAYDRTLDQWGKLCLGDGNVGIGTEAPERNLHIRGNGSSGAGIFLESTGVDGCDIAWGTGTDRFWVVDQKEDPPMLRFASNGVGGYHVRVSFTEDGKVGINRIAADHDLEVKGNASKAVAGDWLANSDARLKTHIEPLESKDMLQKILALRGVRFEWADTVTGYDRPRGKQYGMVAQDVEKIFPELVQEGADGYLQTAYGTYDPMYIEAIRALHDRIHVLEVEKELIYQRLADMEKQLAEVRASGGKPGN